MTRNHIPAGLRKGLPLICIGGSAGSLDAFARLLRNLPLDLGAAIVIVNHITRQPTQLQHVLPLHTRLPVELIEHRLEIKPNRVFIIPADRELHVSPAGEFQLEPRTKTYGWPDVITRFLRSVAARWDGQVIAVIVSGLDSDGAAALCELKRVGAITIAQHPGTAHFPDMPISAIESGCIDAVNSPEEIAEVVTSVVRSIARQHQTQDPQPDEPG